MSTSLGSEAGKVGFHGMLARSTTFLLYYEKPCVLVLESLSVDLKTSTNPLFCCTLSRHIW